MWRVTEAQHLRKTSGFYMHKHMHTQVHVYMLSSVYILSALLNYEDNII